MVVGGSLADDTEIWPESPASGATREDVVPLDACPIASNEIVRVVGLIGLVDDFSHRLNPHILHFRGQLRSLVSPLRLAPVRDEYA